MRLLFVFVFLLGLVSCGGEEERITEHNISTFKTFYEDGKIKSKKTGNEKKTFILSLSISLE